MEVKYDLLWIKKCGGKIQDSSDEYPKKLIYIKSAKFEC